MQTTNKQELSPNRNELKQVQQSVHMMRNRVHLLRSQLQKEKDAIKKHKSLTQDMVRKKVEISKIAALRNRDVMGVDQQISHLRERNHSLREVHRKQMDSILKAVYLVKLDQARQMKSVSQQNKSLIQQRQQSLKARHRQRRRDMAIQSENAKQRYMEYWKHKLNSIYSANQHDKLDLEQQTQEQKRQLQKYQQEQIQLLEAINKLHSEQNDAKKQYLASLTLSSKEIEQAFNSKNEEKGTKSKEKKSLSPSRLRQIEKEKQWQDKMDSLAASRADAKFKEVEFWSKSPHVSIMSSNDIRMPRASVDPNKLKIILKELKRLQALQQNKK